MLFSMCWQLKPSGDALFDRYARAVRNREAWRLFSGGGNPPSALPDRLLARWEKDFGSDPRYWQLRYWCATLAIPPRPSYFERTESGEARRNQQIDAALQPLREAQTRGIADAETCLILERAQRGLLSDAFESEFSKLKDTSDDAGTAEEKNARRREYIVQAAALNRKYEALELAPLDAAVAASPDCAWAYWQRANYWLSYGENDRALADLRSGNAAQVNRLPMPFPALFVMDQLEQGQRAGSSAIAGAVLENGIHGGLCYQTTDAIKWKERFKEDQVQLLLGDTTDLTQALHQMACRMALSGRGNRMYCFIGAVLVMIPAHGLLRDASQDLTSEQRGVLMQIDGAYQFVLRREAARTTFAGDHWPGLIRSEQRAKHLGAVSDGGDNFFSLYYGVDDSDAAQTRRLADVFDWLSLASCRVPPVRLRALCSFWIDEQRYSQKAYADIFELLQQLDYSTLETPKDWPAGAFWN